MPTSEEIKAKLDTPFPLIFGAPLHRECLREICDLLTLLRSDVTALEGRVSDKNHALTGSPVKPVDLLPEPTGQARTRIPCRYCGAGGYWDEGERYCGCKTGAADDPRVIREAAKRPSPMHEYELRMERLRVNELTLAIQNLRHDLAVERRAGIDQTKRLLDRAEAAEKALAEAREQIKVLHYTDTAAAKIDELTTERDALQIEVTARRDAEDRLSRECQSRVEKIGLERHELQVKVKELEARKSTLAECIERLGQAIPVNQSLEVFHGGSSWHRTRLNERLDGEAVGRMWDAWVCNAPLAPADAAAIFEPPKPAAT